MDLTLMDNNNTEFRTHTNCTYAEDVVLYVPDATTFSYDITSEGTAVCNEGIGDRSTVMVSRLCMRVVTRVTANTDLLIPCYGYAPINPATAYEDAACRDFFAQPLFPNGRATATCTRQQ
jgi:hypothetical protein